MHKFLFAILFLSHLVEAQNIEVIVPAAQIQMMGSNDPFSFQWTARAKDENDSRWQAEFQSWRQENPNLFETRRDVMRFRASEKMPEELLARSIFVIELKGKVDSSLIHLNEGAVMVRGWKAKQTYSLMYANFDAQNTEGKMEIFSRKAKFRSVDHKGFVDLDSFTSQVEFEGLEGELKLSNFSGSSTVAKTKGNITYISQKGRSLFADNEGSLRIQNGKGDVQVQRQQGNIEGESIEGLTIINMAANSKLRMKSSEAGVRVVMPKGSGAFVNVGTQEGSLVFPPPLKLQRLQNLKYARGKLRGNLPGSVYVRSEKATIRVKYE